MLAIAAVLFAVLPTAPVAAAKPSIELRTILPMVRFHGVPG
jgi:hypothetical protein